MQASVAQFVFSQERATLPVSSLFGDANGRIGGVSGGGCGDSAKGGGGSEMSPGDGGQSSSGTSIMLPTRTTPSSP
jgi:hypothetical protein